jgi:hypothetical protein
VVGPATVGALIKVYRLLGLEPGLVFQRVHERSAGGAPAPPVSSKFTQSSDIPGPDEPVVVQVAENVPNGYALPWAKHAPPAAGEVLLDRAAVVRKIAESDAAAQLLTTIFDADPEPPAATRPAPAAEHITGLDQAHSALLRTLATRPSWTRDEFASLAATHGVLPDGAFDLLNEVAIEAVGAPVIEDAATLAVDHDVFQELLT